MNYLTLCNSVLRELNEVELSSSSFSASRGVQTSTKDFVNKAISDLYNAEVEWAWLHQSTVQDTIVGQQEYTLPTNMRKVDFESFYLQPKQVIANILSYKLDNVNNKNYSLKVNSSKNKEITSRDSKGNPLTYRITINVEVEVFRGNSNILFDTINIMKDFTYNYQVNQFELGQYKRNIIESLIVKISEEIIVTLQLM